jgi:hypothetical protein
MLYISHISVGVWRIVKLSNVHCIKRLYHPLLAKIDLMTADDELQPPSELL